MVLLLVLVLVQNGPARKETCSGRASKATALSMPRPSQSKQDFPLSVDWMIRFCTNFCTSLTGSNRATRLSLLTTLDASVAVCIACEVATVNVAPEV
jgi:hypothetical protein